MILGIIQYATLILAIVGLLLVIYKISKGNKTAALKSTLLFIPIGLMFIAIIIDNYSYSSQYESIIHVITFEEEFELEIVRLEDRNYLRNTLENNEVTYLNKSNDKNFQSKLWNPIYIDEIDHYYILIMSTDNTKEITSNRWQFGDYERYNLTDRLLLIQKETGYVFYIQEHEEIGSTINLDSFQEGNQLITYNVYLPHENGISVARYYHIDEDYDPYKDESWRDITEGFVSDWSIGGHHVHVLGDPSEIIDFQLAGNYIFYRDSYGYAYACSFTFNEYDVRFHYYDVLMDQTHVINGYAKATEEGIYYLSNLYEVKLYKNQFYSEVIETNATRDNWESFIPAS